MRQPTTARPRLDRRAWAFAALEVLAESGPAAVAVEPIARRLGATKGSFYWHFSDRRALLVAALELYEQAGTEGVIARVQGGGTGSEEMSSLVSTVFSETNRDPVYHALLAESSDPDVAPVLARITRRRIDYLVGVMTRLGYEPAGARRRGILAYTSWLGLIEAERAAGGKLFPSRKARKAYVSFLEEILLIGADG